MGRFAIISDIHGNLHALEAVFARLAEETVDALICLGDIVGYGPNPGPCIDIVTRHSAVIVRGNHDEAAVDPVTAESFNGPARQAIHWTINHLGALHLNALLKLKPTDESMHPEVMAVHDCPVPAPTDYVHDKVMAALAFTGVHRRVCLLGHTHVPMVFETTTTDPAEPLTAPQITGYLPHDGEPIELSTDCRYICNPGSVGQPRDADPRASYAILDMNENTFTVHRQEYDVVGAQRATEEAGLPMILAERLAEGA